MQTSGKIRIAARPVRVARVLKDPESLRRILPGCESVTRNGAAGYDAVFAREIGPLKLRMKVALAVIEAEPRRRYRIEGSGSSLMAGKVAVGCDIALEPNARGTDLEWQGTVELGGMLAKVATGIVNDPAGRAASLVFRNLKHRVEAMVPRPGSPVPFDQDDEVI
jgi:carbon monoxide dehydrogenase subunit G